MNHHYGIKGLYQIQMLRRSILAIVQASLGEG